MSGDYHWNMIERKWRRRRALKPGEIGYGLAEILVPPPPTEANFEGTPQELARYQALIEIEAEDRHAANAELERRIDERLNRTAEKPEAPPTVEIVAPTVVSIKLPKAWQGSKGDKASE